MAVTFGLRSFRSMEDCSFWVFKYLGEDLGSSWLAKEAVSSRLVLGDWFPRGSSLFFID